MQVSDSFETVSESLETAEILNKAEECASSVEEIEPDGEDVVSKARVLSSVDESIIDISGKRVDLSVLSNAEEASVKGLYMYRNVFNLIPKSVGSLVGLKTLKFFGNEIDLFPAELSNLMGLENLQVKISSTGFGNASSLKKIKGLKELELTKVPRRSSVLTMLSEVSGLKSLTKLSVCHFSIRYLPPEIGCLSSLEYLDLSFNKMKSLPNEISYLSSLILLKVAHNKLVELPLALASLRNLESLDLSNNRLTSLDLLDLYLMHKLRDLNLKYNKLRSYCKIPPWICCNLEGNSKDVSYDDSGSSPVEMDVYESIGEENTGSVYHTGTGSNYASLGPSSGNSSSSRCFYAQRSSKRWKRKQQYYQLRARQERLNSSRKWKGEGLVEGMIKKADGLEQPEKPGVTVLQNSKETTSDVISLDGKDKKVEETKGDESCMTSGKDEICSDPTSTLNDCQCSKVKSSPNGGESKYYQSNASLSFLGKGTGEEQCDSSLKTSKTIHKPKRHFDGDLDNPKPSKYSRPVPDNAILARKYSNISFCSTEDRMLDGFYDAGRSRPFMSLSCYDETSHLDSREVILLDREKDEELDAITFSARALFFRLKQSKCLAKEGEGLFLDHLQTASLLALFVSDHFGGSDRNGTVERTRKLVSGSNYCKPFVCTCSTGNRENTDMFNKQGLNFFEDAVFADLCEQSLQSIKSRRNSVVVPIGTLQFGVCRHRALLMKYLCDRLEPPLPCELVRGYLDFTPHAWNVVPVFRGDSWVRMVVDACHPHDIREETDPEYFCRYIPLTRINNAPITAASTLKPGCSFPSLAACGEMERAPSSSLVRCKFGSIEAAAKVRTLEVGGSSIEEIRNFEYNCLGEVRMLGILKHNCIVETYGHQISSKWITSKGGNVKRRILQSSIFMEYMKGGSLKSHIEKLAKGGEKHVPVELAITVARSVVSALAELHSKHIIHRDIKSENVLIDSDDTKTDGSVGVKLCDFDRAVPLRSYLDRCCIAHKGVPPPNVCVGTPRWMAPEVLRSMCEHNFYGLEVDVWSYGCLIFELLTLQIPYFELSEQQIHEALQMGSRPKLPAELEAVGSSDEDTSTNLCKKLDLSKADLDTIRFLIGMFHRCTKENPADRPSAGDLYEMILSHTRKADPSNEAKK